MRTIGLRNGSLRVNSARSTETTKTFLVLIDVQPQPRPLNMETATIVFVFSCSKVQSSRSTKPCFAPQPQMRIEGTARSR